MPRWHPVLVNNLSLVQNLKSPASAAYQIANHGRFYPVASITRDRLRRPQVQVGVLMPLPGKEFGQDHAACTLQLT